jgi:hypothetical protein
VAFIVGDVETTINIEEVMKKTINLAHMKNAGENTIKNRKKKLRERMVRIIDNSTLPGSEKIFVKQAMKSIIDEMMQIYDVHGTSNKNKC